MSCLYVISAWNSITICSVIKTSMVTVTNIVILILTNIAATLQVPEYAIVVGGTSTANSIWTSQ